MQTISIAEAQAFDQKAQEELRIPSLILMENAGRSAAEEAIKSFKGSGKRVAVICGTGNNGGDGLVAARHLLNAGFSVDIYLIGDPAKLKNDPGINHAVLVSMGQKIKRVESAADLQEVKSPGLIIDAIFGIGLKAEIKEPYLCAIKYLNGLKMPILAIDVPSGLNADTGEIMGAAIKAKITVAFVAAKIGFFLKDGPSTCGQIIVRDIGISW